jgi:hypothetical protein
MSYDGSIQIDTSLNTTGFNNGLKSMVGSLGKLTAALGVTIGIAAGFQFLKAGEKAARSLSTALSGLGFVTKANGRDFQQAKSFIDNYISDGLVPATDAIEAYKNMVSRGYDTSQIEAMMGIMKDSAVYNRQSAFSIGEAIVKTTQGLRMENSMLTDSVGIQKNVAKMWDEYAASIGTTANRLTLAQKRQAEFNGFMAEGGVFAGAAAEYLNTYAGKLSQLSAGFTNLKVAVGNSVIPIINAILPAINAAVTALTRFFNRIAVIMQVLFGYDPSATVAAYEQSMGGVASTTQRAADAQDELAKNTEKAQKAAKGALASFDQLNVLQQKDEGAGSGDSGIITPVISDTPIKLPAIDTSAADASLERLRAKVEAFKESLKRFFEPLAEPLAKLRDAFSNLGGAIGRALKPLFESEGWKTFAESIRDGVIVVIELLAMALNKIAEWIDKYPEEFRAFATVLGIVAVAFLMITNPVALVIGIITLLLSAIGLLAQNWDKVQKVAVDTWENIKGAWNKSAEWIQTNVTDPIINLFKQAWENIKQFAVNAWIGIKGAWSSSANWIRTTVTDPIKNAFGDAGDWIKDKWDSILTGVKDFGRNAINAIIGFVNGMINAVAGGLNFVIDKINSINIKIPDWVPLLGGKEWGLYIPQVVPYQIPLLATGAVIPPNAAFAAVLGDQKSGRNIEAPENLIRQIVREETEGISGGQNITVQFGGTMGELIRVLRPEIQKEDKRVGKSLITRATT